MITWDKTNRFFRIGTFKDRYGTACSIQESSLATEDCVWLGVDDADPKIMAVDAIKLGMDTKGQTTGWVPYPLPEEVGCSTRMHLTKPMAEELILVLSHFVKTGYLPQPSEAELKMAFADFLAKEKENDSSLPDE